MQQVYRASIDVTFNTLGFDTNDQKRGYDCVNVQETAPTHDCVTADPTIANSFGHTAYDLAKDQIAGDERTVLKDKSEVRAVLEEYDAERRAERRRPSKDAAPAEPLPPEGTAVAMQLEVVADAKAREENESTAKVATALAAKKFAKKAKKKSKKKGGAKKKS